MVNFQDNLPTDTGNCYHFLLNNAHYHILSGLKWQWNGEAAFAPATDELSTAKMKKKILQAVKPTPGWHLFSMGFDKDKNISFVEFDGVRAECKMKKEFPSKTTNLQLGAYQGYLDELRIQITRAGKAN